MTHHDSRDSRDWQKDEFQGQNSSDGYRVQAIRVGGAWRFVAWGPDQGDIRPLMREHYAISQPVPSRREDLGCYSTAREARAVCDTHAAGPP